MADAGPSPSWGGMAALIRRILPPARAGGRRGSGDALRAVLDIMTAAQAPAFVVWGAERRLFYNDACSDLLGARHPAALGQPIGAAWPEGAARVTPALDAVYAGAPAQLVGGDAGGPSRAASPSFTCSALRPDGETVAGAYCLGHEIEHPGSSARSYAFQLALEEQLRDVAEPREALAITARALGEHLGASRVGYAEIDIESRVSHVQCDWTDGSTPSLVGRRGFSEFASEVVEALQAGQAVVIEDALSDPRLPKGRAERFAGISARGVLAAPLVRLGKPMTMLFIHNAQPRAWTALEVRTAEQVAERTWLAVQRARADSALRESEARFRAMADCAPAPVWVTAAAGGIEFVNQAFAEFAGRRPEELVGRAWTEIVHPDDLDVIFDIRDRARSGLTAFALEIRLRRADGEWRFMRANSQPRFDSDGAFVGYVGLAVDVTELRLAETALRESEERFRLVAENAPVNLWMSDAHGACIYLNGAQRAFWGVGEDLSGFDWNDGLLPADRHRVAAIVSSSLEQQRPYELEARHRRADGAVRILRTRAEPRRDAEGRFIGMIGVNVDVTVERQAALHQRLLLNELNHRVKNTLATVQSIARQTLRGPGIAKARDDFTARLLALSAAHNVLTRENWDSADLGEIALQAVTPYEAAGPQRFTLDGPPVRVSARAALALSMALHELATNAAKYGALNCEGGTVRIRWWSELGRDAEHVIRLEWREAGGPPVTPPTSRGFGTRLLLQGLAVDLGGAAELDYAPEGLICRIRAPAASPPEFEPDAPTLTGILSPEPL